MIHFEPTIASLSGLHLPPRVALVLTLGLIYYLFRRDIKERPDVTGALWLPLLWILLIFTRAFSTWLMIWGLPGYGASSLEEGSPIDAAIYFILIGAGLYVLNKRA